MANLKNLIGKALNRATSSKPSDEGNGTKTRVIKKGMTPKQGMEYKAKETNESIKKGFDIINENKFKASRPGFNPNVPASTKTTKPAPIQAAKEKRDNLQAKYGTKTYSSELGGYSPKRKEEKAQEVKKGFSNVIKETREMFKKKGKSI